MKNSFFVLLLSLVLVVTACGNEEKETTNEPKDDEAIEETEQEEETNPQEEEKDGGMTEEKEDLAEVDVQPSYIVNEKTWKVEPIKDANDKVVLLTIDDAPDKHALEMAKTLSEKKVPAIFFVNGHFLQSEESKKTLKEIADLGFPIGNHTYHHENLTEISEEKQKEEIISLNDLVEEIIGSRPQFFRAPFGANTDTSLRIAKEEEMIPMNWTFGYDWEVDYQSKDALEKIMVENPYLSNGAILLTHDRSWTNEALEGIINGIQEKGYEFLDPNKIQKEKEAA